MDAFWGILFITIMMLLVFNKFIDKVDDDGKPIPTEQELKKAKKKGADTKQKEEYIKELRKKGYSEELIAIILPTIMNDK